MKQPQMKLLPPKLTLLTSVHNDADDADNCNRVIGIELLKAFSCVKNGAKSKNQNKI